MQCWFMISIQKWISGAVNCNADLSSNYTLKFRMRDLPMLVAINIFNWYLTKHQITNARIKQKKLDVSLLHAQCASIFFMQLFNYNSCCFTSSKTIWSIIFIGKKGLTFWYFNLQLSLMFHKRAINYNNTVGYEWRALCRNFF